MKRIISVILAVLSVMTLFPVISAGAAQGAEPEEVIWLEDGSYIVVTTEAISTYSSATVTKNKHYTYCGANGVAEWKATLTGTFSYTGVTATCTASSCSVSIYNNNWYVISKSATKSANTAKATVTMGYKTLGVTVGEKTYEITLTCDKYGIVR